MNSCINNSVSILLGLGDGTFGVAQNFSEGVGVCPHSVTSGDLNGDGLLDLVTANSISDNVSLLLGLGGGAFSVAQNFAVGNGAGSVLAEDFNGNGLPDLATTNYSDNSVSILLR